MGKVIHPEKQNITNILQKVFSNFTKKVKKMREFMRFSQVQNLQYL